MRNLLIAALAALALSACGALSTPNFVQRAAMIDMYEVEAGKIASQKGQSDAVKQFGQQMVDAHTKTAEELKGIVQSENIKVELRAKLASKYQMMVDDLNNASAENFDATYVKQQVGTHKKAVGLFEDYSNKGDNAAVKQFTAKTLPVIKQHLEEARKLRQ
jgi:putative membrane protein